MDGGCGCGQVRYTIKAPQMPVVYACHCTDCQTQSGSSFALQMPVFEAMLAVAGDLVSGDRTQPSGAIGTIFACSKCLVRVYSKNSTRPGMVTIKAGTLNDSQQIVPKFHLWTVSKQPWVIVPRDSVALEQQPVSTEEWMQLLLPAMP
jgi:hypothetical protein